MKYIRECRMGPPKSFKTGAVVGTYPKPMLYFQFDAGGLDVIPPKGTPPGTVPLDLFYEEIIFCKPDEVGTYLTSAEPPKVLCLDFTQERAPGMDLLFKPTATSIPLNAFVNAFNRIAAQRPFPWQTVVLDSVTGFSDAILSHISQANPNALSDARQWAYQVGAKVRQTILAMTSWPCHVVFIMHSAIEKNEITGVITELPNVYSGLRNDIGALFSQFFYTTKQGTKPIIWTTDQMFVKGIGPRWPANLPPIVDPPTFQQIYGQQQS